MLAVDPGLQRVGNPLPDRTPWRKPAHETCPVFASLLECRFHPSYMRQCACLCTISFCPAIPGLFDRGHGSGGSKPSHGVLPAHRD